MEAVTMYGVNNFASEKELFCNDCGIQKFGTNDPISVIRENGRFDYHILMMKSGSCTFRHGEHLSVLNEKETVIYFPNEPQEYHFGNNYSESYWIHFSGTRVPYILECFAINSGFYHCHSAKIIYDIFDELILYYKKDCKSNRTELKISTLILQLLQRISENIQPTNPKLTITPDVLNFLHNHYNEDISLESIAKKHGIGERRLTQIFISDVGLTPHNYKRNLQMENAKKMLLNSEMSITEISIKVGFDDPLYFSRVFRNHTQMSPKQYRAYPPDKITPR